MIKHGLNNYQATNIHWKARLQIPHLQVVGNGGLLETGIRKPQEVVQWSGGDIGGIRTAPSFQNMDHFRESFKLEIEHFIDVLTGIAFIQLVTEKQTMWPRGGIHNDVSNLRQKTL